MKKSRMAVILSILGALVMIVAACAPAVTPTPTATPTPAPVATTPTPAPGVATPTPTLAPTGMASMPAGYGYSEFGEWGMPLNMPPPVYGGIFREGNDAPPHWDSHRSYSAPVGNPTGLTRDGLIRFSPYLDIANIPARYEPQYIGPALAEKWEVSQDGRMVTFYLKRGVKWHDGKPFTARDVKHTLDKLLDPSRSAWAADLVMVDRVETVDDYTIKVYLKYSASRLFLVIMAVPQTSIQPEHLKDVSYRTPEFLVGTGPFILKSVTAGIELEWVKNPDYHFKGRPYLDGVKWIDLQNEAAISQSIAAGQLDYAYMQAREEHIAILKRVAPEVTIRVNQKVGNIPNIVFSLRKEGPWQDVRVRKALTMVIELREICLARAGKLADQMCNPGVGYFFSAPAGPGLPFKEYEEAWWLNKPIEQRVAEAKRLLAEAGYASGFRIEWLASSALGPELLVVHDTWRKLLNIGVDVKIIARAQYTDLQVAGNFQASSQSSISWTGALESMVSGVYIKGGPANYSFYSHPLVEELYIKLLLEKDYSKARDIFHQIERLLIADVPSIPLGYIAWMMPHWPYIKPQMFIHPIWVTGYNSTYTIIWLDKNDPTYAKRAR